MVWKELINQWNSAAHWCVFNSFWTTKELCHVEIRYTVETAYSDHSYSDQPVRWIKKNRIIPIQMLFK